MKRSLTLRDELAVKNQKIAEELRKFLSDQKGHQQHHEKQFAAILYEKYQKFKNSEEVYNQLKGQQKSDNLHLMLRRSLTKNAINDSDSLGTEETDPLWLPEKTSEKEGTSEEPQKAKRLYQPSEQVSTAYEPSTEKPPNRGSSLKAPPAEEVQCPESLAPSLVFNSAESSIKKLVSLLNSSPVPPSELLSELNMKLSESPITSTQKQEILNFLSQSNDSSTSSSALEALSKESKEFILSSEFPALFTVPAPPKYFCSPKTDNPRFLYDANIVKKFFPPKPTFLKHLELQLLSAHRAEASRKRKFISKLVLSNAPSAL